MKKDLEQTRAYNRAYLRDAACSSLQSAETLLQHVAESFGAGESPQARRDLAAFIKRIEKLKKELKEVRI